jgi:protein arginine kinase
MDQPSAPRPDASPQGSGFPVPWSSAAVRSGVRWLTGPSPRPEAGSDVVISSRVRLARNLAEFPFVARATSQQRESIVQLMQQAVQAALHPWNMLFVDLSQLDALDRMLLVERHVISKEHAKGDQPRACSISRPDEHLSLMINEEDHIRLQALLPALSLTQAYELASSADDELEACLDFAFSPQLGYLTACPTNLGTASRMSVMLHLPGLRLTGEIEKMKRAATEMGMAVRGFYGENSEANGDFYQISNQVTLGKPEGLFLIELEKQIIPRVVDYELTARAALLSKRRRFIEDTIHRAAGLLRSCRLLTPDECMSHLSMLRLGVLTGLITDVSLATINRLTLQTQSGHLQRLVGKPLDQQLRREMRADIVRSVLSQHSDGLPPSTNSPAVPPGPHVP